jgi:hypothetical protein
MKINGKLKIMLYMFSAACRTGLFCQQKSGVPGICMTCTSPAGDISPAAGVFLSVRMALLSFL